jgi:hypothetical protein
MHSAKVVLQTIVMQPTTRFHHGITNAILQEADFIFHNPVAFHPTNGVFDADSDNGNTTIGGLLRWGEFPPRGFFLGWIIVTSARTNPGTPSLDRGHCRGASDSPPLSQDLIVGLPFIGDTQEANLTGFIDHQEVFDRTAFLFTAVVALLVFWIGWAVDRSLSTIMPKRGDMGPSLVCLLVRSVANSAAVRAGSSSCCRKAWFSMVWRR